MKNMLTIAILLFGFNMLNAQDQGKIWYSETISLDVEMEGLPESILELIPKSHKIEKELLFNKDESVYRDSKEKEANEEEQLIHNELDSEGSRVKIMTMNEDAETILYTSFKDNKKINQEGIMGKSFVIESDVEKLEWKLTDEKVKYLGYECQKAVFKDEEELIVAWFTPQIPAQIGPHGYGGLPGAILMLSLSAGDLEIKATRVDFAPLDDDAIAIPKKGKKVSREEFEKISEEKLKDMESMFGGKGTKTFKFNMH